MKYSIEGTPLPVVICDLEAGETMITEKGAMSWMTPNMKMETVGGGVGKMIGRMFSGEAMFQNHYTAEGGPGQIAYASSFPGSILAFDIGQKEMIVQKSAFLASTEAFSAARALSCRGFQAPERLLWRSTDMSRNTIWRLDRVC